MAALCGEFKAFAAGSITHRDEINKRPAWFGQGDFLGDHHLQYPFESCGKTNGRKIWSSNSGDKPVESSAAANGVLRAEISGYYFKDRFVVVIEPSDDFVINDVGDLNLVK